MKITKFVHSCLLVETQKQVILVDPGQFSWESNLFNLGKIDQLDVVVITHEHFDHFYEPFVQAILQKFPNVQFVSTPEVVARLQSLGVLQACSESVEEVEIFSRQRHAQLTPLGDSPENIAVHIADALTIAGDRHDLEESREILALPVTAPWGAMTEAAGMALKLIPKKIIPVHDWHWNDVARRGAYDRLEAFFAEHNIVFIKPVDGQSFEV